MTNQTRFCYKSSLGFIIRFVFLVSIVVIFTSQRQQSRRLQTTTSLSLTVPEALDQPHIIKHTVSLKNKDIFSFYTTVANSNNNDQNEFQNNSQAIASPKPDATAKTDNTVGLTTGETEDRASSTLSTREDEERNNNNNPFAYVSLIYGCQPEQEYAGYRSYIAHLLASAKLLKQFNATSQADIVVLIKISKESNATTILKHEEQMIEQFGIKIKYLPHTNDDWQETNNFYINQLIKVHLLNMTEYERILFMDADVLPLTNLDYLFKLSHGPHAKFKDNIIISSQRVPMIGGFFVLKPNATGYQIILNKINKKQLHNGLGARNFDKHEGWGHNFVERNDSWISNDGKERQSWKFYGAYADQGLLYYYPKYLQKSMTQIMSRKIINYGPGPNNTVVVEKEWDIKNRRKNSPLWKYSKNQYDFERPDCKRVTVGLCVPPYNDHAHFMGKDLKPWKNLPFSRQDLWDTTAKLTATRLWWQTVGRLKEDGINSATLLSGASEKLRNAIKLGIFEAPLSVE